MFLFYAKGSYLIFVPLLIKNKDMKFLTHILIVVVLFSVETISAQKQNITATVVNATSDKGNIKYALYTKESFRKQPLQAKEAKIIKGKSTVVFNDVPVGEYAIICFHDANSNNRMDFEPNGMPLEDYGASNNKLSRVGPPLFDDAKFIVKDNDVSFEIKF